MSLKELNKGKEVKMFTELRCAWHSEFSVVGLCKSTKMFSVIRSIDNKKALLNEDYIKNNFLIVSSIPTLRSRSN